jgi:hypothetical protein
MAGRRDSELDRRSHDELLVEVERELESLLGAGDTIIPGGPFDDSARGQRLHTAATKWTTVIDLVQGHLHDHEQPDVAFVDDEDCFETVAVAAGVLSDIETWLQMAGAQSVELEAKTRRIARLARAIWDSPAWKGNRSVGRTELARGLEALAREPRA